jgi:hypothetical protein
MSTHALVGVRTADGGFRARYVHSDGYPSSMLPALQRVIHNYKAAGSQDLNPVTYILGNHWSSFSNYGHNPAQSHTHIKTWYTEANEVDHTFLYIIDTDTLTITTYVQYGEGWTELNPSNTIKEKTNA